jgi:hypothetical protein
MLLELLEEFDLDIELDVEAGLETCRLCWLEPREPLLERDFAAKASSQNNKRAKNMLKNR